MGKLDVDPVIIHHFSHPHVLQLVKFEPRAINPVICSGCKLEASGWVYSCSTCSYCLHKACSQMPQELNHRVDLKHTLLLLPSPAYPEGAFKCNACGGPGTGFCYHCKECQLDLHTLCAFMPASVSHGAHKHTLNLCFNPPYHINGFRCDICKGSGSNRWLYRCTSCDFDAQTSCAMTRTQSQPTSRIQQMQQPQLTKSQSAPLQVLRLVNDSWNLHQTYRHFSPQPTPVQQMTTPSFQTQCLNPGIGYPYRSPPILGQASAASLVAPPHIEPPRTSRMDNELVGQMVQGFVGGLAEQAGQSILQSILGGF